MTASFFIGSFHDGGAVTKILSGYSCKVSLAGDNHKMYMLIFNQLLLCVLF